MAVQDLRGGIERGGGVGGVERVGGAGAHPELGGADAPVERGGLVDLYQWERGTPALLFDHMGGYRPGYRLLANVLTSLRRVALSLDLPLDHGPREFVQAWRTQLKDLTPRPA